MAKKSRNPASFAAVPAMQDGAGAATKRLGEMSGSARADDQATVIDMPIMHAGHAGPELHASRESRKGDDDATTVFQAVVDDDPRTAIVNLPPAAQPPSAPPPGAPPPSGPAIAKPRAVAPSSTADAPTLSVREAKLVQGRSDGQQSGPQGLDVRMLWREDLYAAHFFGRPQIVTIGKSGTFPLPPDVMGNKDEWNLVEPVGKDGFALRLDIPGMAGHALHKGDRVDLGGKSGSKTLVFAADTSALVQFGEFAFVLTRAPVPPPQRAALWSREASILLLCLLIASVLLVAPLVAGYNSPEYRDRLRMSYTEKMEERIHELIEVEEAKKPEEEKEEEKPAEEKKQEAPQLVPQAVQQQQIKEEEKRIQKALDQVPDEERKAKIEALVKEAAAKETAAVDAALNDLSAQLPGTKLFAESDDGTGTPNPTGEGGINVIADPNGELGGLAGPGAAGRQPGVGDGKETQKGEIAALGKQTDLGKGPEIGLKEKKQEVVRVGGSVADAEGELPKSVIKAYIATKMGAIKACYQKALQSNPDLSGKVKVAFVILPDGKVPGAKVDDSSLNNSSVEECILNNVRTWKFPQAKGGGTTKVVYPFVFSAH
jgi:TonB family protein